MSSFPQLFLGPRCYRQACIYKESDILINYINKLIITGVLVFHRKDYGGQGATKGVYYSIIRRIEEYAIKALLDLFFKSPSLTEGYHCLKMFIDIAFYLIRKIDHRIGNLLKSSQIADTSCWVGNCIGKTLVWSRFRMDSFYHLS